MKSEYSYNEVKNLLPQKYPFIFIDKVIDITPEKEITCKKNVSGNEWMFEGHFPDNAVFPGVLIIEGMAQAGILLFQITQKMGESMDQNAKTFLLSAVKSRFMESVVPGDEIIYICKVVKMTKNAGIVEARALSNDKLISKADLTFAVKENK